MRFSNGELIQYDTCKNGRGKGTVVGHYRCGKKDMWIVYPKQVKKVPKSLQRKWMCFLAEDSELISTPF